MHALRSSSLPAGNPPLAGRDGEADPQAGRVDRAMDLCGQAALRSTERASLSPLVRRLHRHEPCRRAHLRGPVQNPAPRSRLRKDPPKPLFASSAGPGNALCTCCQARAASRAMAMPSAPATGWPPEKLTVCSGAPPVNLLTRTERFNPRPLRVGQASSTQDRLRFRS